MLLKPVISFIFALAIGLSLVSCDKKSTEPSPEIEKKYYPVSVTRTASYTPDIIRSEFTYNGENQIIREIIYKNEVQQSLTLFTYDVSGKLTNRDYHSETGQLKEQDNITYSPAGLLDRLSHAYVDANRQPTPHHYRLHEFNTDGKISKWTDHYANGSLWNSRTYTYDNAGKVTSPAYDNNGQQVNTSEITLDDHPLPFQNTTINLVKYSGNELQHEIKDLNGNVISAYTNKIIYNEAGYPEKITQTYTDGTVKTEIYKYKTD